MPSNVTLHVVLPPAGRDCGEQLSEFKRIRDDLKVALPEEPLTEAVTVAFQLFGISPAVAVKVAAVAPAATARHLS